MKGEIRLKEWSPFEAEEVIVWPIGFVWAARTAIGGLPVIGFDESVDERGQMDWSIFGLLPVARAMGAPTDTSAIARFVGELTWVPTALLEAGAEWVAEHVATAIATVKTGLGPVSIRLDIGRAGELQACSFARLRQGTAGQLDRDETFAVVFDEEGQFGPYRVPRKIRAGWGLIDGSRDPAEEFFRAELVRVDYL